MASPTKSIAQQPAYTAGASVLFGATAVILAALAFEHIGGYAPCPLCVAQRYAYYIGIPIAFIGLVLMSANRRTGAAVLFLVVGLGFFINAILGGYHAGAEWGFWPGPSTCEQPLQPLSLGEDFSQTLSQTAVASCTEPAWRMFGLSFAGWNVLISLALSATAFYASSILADPAARDAPL